VGEACDDLVCQRRRYHFVPAHLVLGRSEPDPRIGKRVDKYLLLEPLGVGGFGTVYRAVNTALGRSVALKLLTAAPDDPHRDIHMRMFANEATALAQLSHPNIVHLIDAGVDDGLPYIVMEHIDHAATLRDDIEERALAHRRMPATEARAILTAVIAALEAAHAQKIIHRDIKPENIMLQAVSGHGNFVRVLDFGLAKFVSDSTRTARAMGTPRYMAPEQLWARGLGPWTDLYAVGVVAFELMTGRTPFGHSPSEIVARKRDSGYDPLTTVADMPLPEAARAFLKKALAYQPAYRHRSVEELRAAFDAAYDAVLAEGRAELLTVDLANIVVNDDEEAATNALDFAAASEPADELLPEVSGVLRLDEPSVASVVAPQMTMPAPLQPPPRRRMWQWLVPVVVSVGLLIALGFEVFAHNDSGPVSIDAAVQVAQAARVAPEAATAAPVVVAVADTIEPHDAAALPTDIPSETFDPQAAPDVAPSAPEMAAAVIEAPVEDPAVAAAREREDDQRKRHVSAARRLARAKERLAADDLEGAAVLVREGLGFEPKHEELHALDDLIAVDRAVDAKLSTIQTIGDARARWQALSELVAPDGSVSARRLAKLKVAIAPEVVDADVQRGRAALETKDYRSAIAAADAALAIMPRHGDAKALRDAAVIAKAKADALAEQELRERCTNGCQIANNSCEERAHSVAQCIALQPQRCAARCAEEHPDDPTTCTSERCQPTSANVDAWNRTCEDALETERTPCRTSFASCIAACEPGVEPLR